MAHDGAYPGFDSTIDMHLAGMEHLVQKTELLGVSTEPPVVAKTMADRAVAEGRGGDSYAALIEQFREPVGERA